MDTIENKVQQLKELSKKQKKLSEIKQDIASILGSTNIDEKKKIAEKMSKMEYENMNHAKNLQFIVPHIVKEIYEHEGPKGEFIIPEKKPTIVEEPIIEPVVESIQEPNIKENKPVVKTVAKKTIEKPIIKTEPVVETPETSSERIISLDTNKIEKLVTDILKSQDMVKKIERLKIIGSGNELDIDAKIGVSKFLQNIDISLKGRLENTDDSIVASLHEVKANKFENKVKKVMEDNLGTLDKKIKKYFEKKYNRSIEKIQIENGKMNIYFYAVEGTIEPEVVNEESAQTETEDVPIKQKGKAIFTLPKRKKKIEKQNKEKEDMEKIMKEINKISDELEEAKKERKQTEIQLEEIQKEKENIQKKLDSDNAQQ